MATIVTTREVAQFLRLTESTICKLVAEGQLPGFKIGDSWRFDMDEIMEHISAAKVAARQKKSGNESGGRGMKKTCRKN